MEKQSYSQQNTKTSSEETDVFSKNITKKTSTIVTTKVWEGQVTQTPWGVTLKPVPRTNIKQKTTLEQTSEIYGDKVWNDNF